MDRCSLMSILHALLEGYLVHVQTHLLVMDGDGDGVRKRARGIGGDDQWASPWAKTPSRSQTGLEFF